MALGAAALAALAGVAHPRDHARERGQRGGLPAAEGGKQYGDRRDLDAEPELGPAEAAPQQGALEIAERRRRCGRKHGHDGPSILSVVPGKLHPAATRWHHAFMPSRAAVVYSPDYVCDIGPHVFPVVKFRLLRDRLVEEGDVGAAELLEPRPAPPSLPSPSSV